MAAHRYLKATREHIFDGKIVPRGTTRMLPTPEGLETIYNPDIEAALASGFWIEVPDVNSPLPDDPEPPGE